MAEIDKCNLCKNHGVVYYPDPGGKLIKTKCPNCFPPEQDMEFTIKVKMQERWVAHFLSMLRYMERLGGIGSSREVTFFSDGDGDFRPTFSWDKSLPEDAEPINNTDGNVYYDAG